MEKLEIIGGNRLSGIIPISGAKNAALPLMCASLLVDGKLTLQNVPKLKDVYTLIDILKSMGVESKFEENCLELDGSKINSTFASYELVKTMRASILVLGPLLARYGKAKVSLPGGCAIGSRPVDQHIKALERLGAEINIENGYVVAEGKLKGNEVYFDMPTVGGTENTILAATLAEGTTVINNAAMEPEIVDLCDCLRGMGAQISGDGSPTIVIQGVKKLNTATHKVIADRIEAGTFVIASAITNSNLTLTNVKKKDLVSILSKLTQAGISLVESDEGITVYNDAELKTVDIQTQPHPGFPTDMQAQFTVLNCIASGVGTVEETIFENRFMHVAELNRMNANIDIHGNHVKIEGSRALKGATVMATDLRASASLVIAGLVATGTTTVDRIYHLDRGYENIEQKLESVGANIRRLEK
ncbi:UDP-N-acetylglucosamine 1-carboxyvinyltransferase [Vibrio crassostreae]|uniref:UDP-N-acetylglucosamine 1-carboxyvinyltransferase n=1 Tax=Vibrio crassostreae TaxID=246167 RepID=A0ABP1WVY2_9VIBR|nr:UDP-N-acetylglucosamine 1-carboxyvinyltransferase [Vibrio crassostreae]TCL27631.1 UDP-N-acetylglucosamine 1-carboxyvinyltransferase [Vibrio crassostreae]TCT49006.1 UDP-N-acetylglucosamine 1-carboxyvinyltransferase [Vibrio crassostreae]TCT58570.1 UDP-N-acetylglucosamine 1-carboxyvinyltransferase [Vibrio crassostreae]CAK1709535.1 UDP-N-acetylglucosamine 1-carboxyvinyltransferase [Vibrio crassostreae]CAK1711336.1 UDP-N-acetylglucosamine 1-carboxyvinyltransferase [Vibrio crassostreae]